MQQKRKSLVKAKVKRQVQNPAILIKAEALIHGTNSSQRYSRQRQGPKSQHDVIQKRLKTLGEYRRAGSEISGNEEISTEQEAKEKK